jgi:hypothetical protein
MSSSASVDLRWCIGIGSCASTHPHWPIVAPMTWTGKEIPTTNDGTENWPAGNTRSLYLEDFNQEMQECYDNLLTCFTWTRSDDVKPTRKPETLLEQVDLSTWLEERIVALCQ